jgi:3-deoxy-D-manno-octulosonic-acid transferase
MLGLYNTALLPLRAAALVWAGVDRGSEARTREWGERRARVLPGLPPGGIWMHGASVGEARIVKSLAAAVRRRRPDVPLAVSAITRTGRGQLPGPPDVESAFFAPLDFTGLPGRVLDAVRPAALVLVETELWPNLLHEADARRVPVGLINGRLSAGRMSRYRRFGGLYRPLLERIARVGAQSAADAERFRELGVPAERLETTGNVKYDLPPPTADPAAVRERFGLAVDRPVLVAGSTGEGEEIAVLDAFAQMRERFPDLYLVLAPRYPARADDVERLVRERGLELTRVTTFVEGSAVRDGLLVDTIGELASLYTVARIAFVGGSLVPIGGHNVLEPAACGVPVLFGPHTENADEPARALLDAGAACRVGDADALAARCLELLGNDEARHRMGERAEAVVRANRGAMERTLSILEALLSGERSA